MTQQKRIGMLIVALVLIAGSIWFLEKAKIHPVVPEGGGTAADIAVPTVQRPTSTASSSAAVPAVPDVAARLRSISIADEKAGYPSAVEITNPAGFVNTPPFTLASLVGKKVVLLDFWTYSCINCIRTIPHLSALYEKYGSQGLVVVGVHTPEFEFEKDISNIRAAVQKFGIKYPVVVDSNYGTWQAYQNQYWPHEYLIDVAGRIVHDKIGEGGYDEEEARIRGQLFARDAALGISTTTLARIPLGGTGGMGISDVQSPETYFGSARNDYLGNGASGTTGVQTLTAPTDPELNKLYLDGKWNFVSEYASPRSAGAKIIFRYHAAKAFLVAASPSGAAIEVLQDGKPIGADAGSDVPQGKGTIKESRLYNIVNNQSGSGEHTLEITIDSPGVEVYTFTFG